MSGSSAVGSRRFGAVGCRVVGLVAVVAVWLSVLGGCAAWSTTGHAFADQFGGLGDGDGQFREPLGNGPSALAVMASTGEVFTVDEGQGANGAVPRVQRFGADGTFASKFPLDPSYTGGVTGLAADPGGAGAVYVASGANGGVPSVAKYSTAGVLAYALNATGSSTSINAGARVAVDLVEGSVYVTATHDDGRQVVARFSGSTGLFLDFFDGSDGADSGFLCAPTGLAVDGSSQVYVLDPCKGASDPTTQVPNGRVDRYSSAGAFGVTVDDGSRGALSAVAADPASDEVYVTETGPVGVQVTHFSAGGAGVVYTFAAAEVGGVRALAVSGAGTVYTSDATKPFVQWFTSFDGPTVVTGAASSIGERSAVLEGTINPEGVASSYHFEYGTDLTYGRRVPAADDADAGGGGADVSASVPVTGLEPNKTYFFRLVGSNASGSIAGASGTFMTLVGPPVVEPSGPAFAAAITPRSVRLHGSVNPTNSFTLAHFEYGTTTAYGTSAPDIFLLGGTDQAVPPSDIAGLEPGTTYHFRLAAGDLFGGNKVFGPDRTFVTAPAAGGGATNVTAGRARLAGTINPHGVATSYHFNYGLTAAYGSSTPEVDGGSGDADRLVSAEISGLSSDTTYHVQVVATSADGVVRSGGDGLFRTAPAPTAAVVGPTGLSSNAATLAGEVNTFGQTGTYRFDVWSLDSSYAFSTAERPVSGYASAERVAAAVSGLPAGETLVVQLTVSSNDALRLSDLATFATPAMPKVFPVPPASGDASVYGCVSPRLNAYNGRPKPGETITITGTDLGVGGNVVLGDRSLKPSDWSASGFKILVPEDMSGSLALTIDCGRRSNAVAVAVFEEPENGFAVTGRSVSGSSATLRVRLPGPGKLESFGAGTRAAKLTVKKSGTASLKVGLTRAGAKALNRAASRTRTVKVRVRFTPAGGRSASKTVTIAFKRKGGR